MDSRNPGWKQVTQHFYNPTVKLSSQLGFSRVSLSSELRQESSSPSSTYPLSRQLRLRSLSNKLANDSTLYFTLSFLYPKFNSTLICITMWNVNTDNCSLRSLACPEPQKCQLVASHQSRACKGIFNLLYFPSVKYMEWLIFFVEVFFCCCCYCCFVCLFWFSFYSAQVQHLRNAKSVSETSLFLHGNVI